MESTQRPINTSTVGHLTTYELRQELLRRNALDIEESRINHRTMLERLIIELVKEEKRKRKSLRSARNFSANFSETEAEFVEAQATKLIADKAEAKRIRELKKLEALERSKARQANSEYFAKIVEDNRPPAPKIVETEHSDVTTPHDPPEVETENEENFDPFRRKFRW